MLAYYIRMGNENIKSQFDDHNQQDYSLNDQIRGSWDDQASSEILKSERAKEQQDGSGESYEEREVEVKPIEVFMNLASSPCSTMGDIRCNSKRLVILL